MLCWTVRNFPHYFGQRQSNRQKAGGCTHKFYDGSPSSGSLNISQNLILNPLSSHWFYDFEKLKSIFHLFHFSLPSFQNSTLPLCVSQKPLKYNISNLLEKQKQQVGWVRQGERWLTPKGRNTRRNWQLLGLARI